MSFADAASDGEGFRVTSAVEFASDQDYTMVGAGCDFGKSFIFVGGADFGGVDALGFEHGLLSHFLPSLVVVVPGKVDGAIHTIRKERVVVPG